MLKKIGNQKQLFLDDYIIKSLDGVSKKLNQPNKYAYNPVLTPWDANMLMSFSSIIFDEDENIFSLWHGIGEFGQGDADFKLAYATSKDGLRWETPSLGIFDYRGTTDNNIVMERNGCGCSVFKYPHETDPAKRYKMLFPNDSYRTCAAYSADGLHWVNYNEGRPVIFEGRDSQNVGYWDEQLGKYVAIVRERSGQLAEIRQQIVADEAVRKAYFKLWGQWPDKKTLRRVGQAESSDVVHWSPVRVVMEADSIDPVLCDEFYNMEVMQYEGLRIGLMTVFSYEADYCRGQVQLTYSRDGMHWRRGGNREVFLPLSDRPGDFDWGAIYPVQCPLMVGDEIWIYYSGYGFDHELRLPDGVTDLKTGVGLAKLRLDGFVSVDAKAKEGTLTTKPFTFQGNQLLINADAKDGRVTVEIQNAAGEPIEGFCKQDCDALKTDEIRHTVRWKGKVDVKALEGKAIKLKFYLEQAKLFSFGFGLY